MTPCEELGYKVGDKFQIIETDEEWISGFNLNQIVTLYEDDGSREPLFCGSNATYRLCNNKEGAYLDLSQVKPV